VYDISKSEMCVSEHVLTGVPSVPLYHVLSQSSGE